jgi:hypothetical protein
MKIFNLEGLGAPDKPKKKKIKYAEIDFTSYHSFLRLRKVKKINLKLLHTKKTQPNPQCEFDRHECDYNTHECDFKTHKSDFYTQSAVSIRSV